MNVSAREKVQQAMRSEAKVAALQEQNAPPGQDSAIMADPGSRQIPKTYKYDPKALKPLARMLWAMSVSMGHALQAYRTLNRVKSSTVSPDGMLGGRGYVMKITDLRQSLYTACEALSSISDTIHDEISAPHWKPKLAELDKSELDSIDRLIGESEENLDNPEENAEEDEAEVEKSGKPSKTWPPTDDGEEDDEDESASKMPGGGDREVQEKATRPTKEASVRSIVAQALRRATSLVPESLPGPRVETLDRGTQKQDGPGVSFNHDDWPQEPDDWTLGAPMEWATEATSTTPITEPVNRGSTYGLEGVEAQSGLPSSSGPARADYYPGYKPDNQMNVAQSGMPGDGTSESHEIDIDLMNVGYRYERPGLEHADLDGTER